MNEKCVIEIIPVPDQDLPINRIVMSEGIAKQLTIETNQLLEISCSRNSATVEIVVIKEKEPILQCSHSLLTSLLLPIESFTLTLTKVFKNKVELGPIVCVITEISERENNIALGSIEDFCKELALYANKIGVFFYLMSLKSFQQNEGYLYTNKKWVKTVVPYPQVVHNRIHSRKREQSDAFKNIVTELQIANVPYFNDHFLNKWEVHEILGGYDHLTPYIPETKLLENKRILSEMLEKHDCLFIKPVHGSQGRNIFRLSRDHEGVYYLDYTTFSGEIETEYESFQVLFQSLKSRLKKQAFIVQECLPLLLYQEKPLDFRILCQKNSNEQWQITSAVTRVSSKGEFVSNLARGGEIKKVDEVLFENFEAHSVQHIKKLIQELSLEIARAIDQAADGYFAELGIDLALDSEGKPSIIEVNTKPSKNLGQDQFTQKIRPSAKAIINHCMYLANAINNV